MGSMKKYIFSLAAIFSVCVGAPAYAADVDALEELFGIALVGGKPCTGGATECSSRTCPDKIVGAGEEKKKIPQVCSRNKPKSSSSEGPEDPMVEAGALVKPCQCWDKPGAPQAD